MGNPKSVKPTQAELAFPLWGGAREGAGRKPSGPRASVPHTARAEHKARFPVHVTLRFAKGLPNLRAERTHHLVRALLHAASQGSTFRVVHYSLQTNHLHLICEAQNREALTEGLRGLAVRLARKLNRRWGRRGPVIGDRFHSRELETPREARNGLAYGFHNACRHGSLSPGVLDPYSSADAFDGWRGVRPQRVHAPCFIVQARTWLLTVGWKPHGLIDP